MPRVTIELLEGRTQEQKRELVAEVAASISRICKCPITSVTILLRDMPKTDFAKAGILVCDEV